MTFSISLPISQVKYLQKIKCDAIINLKSICLTNRIMQNKNFKHQVKPRNIGLFHFFMSYTFSLKWMNKFVGIRALLKINTEI